MPSSDPPAEPTRPLLEIDGLSKSFGGERALDRVSLTVARGEVHGLLGRNGSGKSTLIKVLAGYHAPEHGGRLVIDGRPVPLPIPPGGLRQYGVAFVHQNLGLIPSLTVVENLYLTELAARNRWRLSYRRLSRRARALFASYGLAIDPETEVRRLSPVQRALLAIVRAVGELRRTTRATHKGLLVLDEPTPFLPRSDVEHLFALIRSITATGASVTFVSHDIDEVTKITDRATILRDAKVVATVPTAETSAERFVELIVGRKLSAVRPVAREVPQRDADIRIEDLSGGTLEGVSVALRRTEIVGLTGLIGSGFDELPYLLFGAPPARSGRLHLGDSRFYLDRLDPPQAIDAGIVLIPGDRLNAGAVGSLTVTDNVTIPVLSTVYRPWLLSRRAMTGRTGRLCRDFDIRPNNPGLRFDSLSGGNQQKALVAKWLQADPRLILLDEPTQGVDIGARRTVLDAISQMAGRGAAVLCASSDFDQLASICTQVLIFSHGRVQSELVGDEVRKETIAEHCYGSTGGGFNPVSMGAAT